MIESVTRNYSGLYRCVLTDMQNNTKNASTELVVLCKLSSNIIRASRNLLHLYRIIVTLRIIPVLKRQSLLRRALLIPRLWLYCVFIVLNLRGL